MLYIEDVCYIVLRALRFNNKDIRPLTNLFYDQAL